MATMNELTAQRPKGTPILNVTDRARSMVLEARAGEDSAGELALWVEVAGTGADGYLYDMFFEDPADAAGGDFVHSEGGLTVVIPSASVSALSGATLDVSSSGGEDGLVMVNPNRPQAGGLPPEVDRADRGLDSDVARRIMALLDEEVNPAIASHGGAASLVAVGPAPASYDGERTGDLATSLDEGPVVAYLALSGGCQGCAMSKATLTQGIEVAIRDAIPTVVGVVDVTDHSVGVNPYY